MTEKATPLVEAYRRDPEQFRAVVREAVRKLAALYERMVAECRLFLERLARACAELRRARPAPQLVASANFKAGTMQLGRIISTGPVTGLSFQAEVNRAVHRQLLMQRPRQL